MLLLAIAGISLSATAVSWWNGHRTEEVRREIEAMERQLQAIRAADAEIRHKLSLPYLRNLQALLEEEMRTRDEVATELIKSLEQARRIKARRFGADETGLFRQLFLELELALSRVNAERAYFAVFKNVISNAVRGETAELPHPGELQLPSDFPREGGLVHFDVHDVPQSLHGYRLTVDDWTDDLDGRAALYDVDHEHRRARVSTARCLLLEANLTDGGGVIPAKVIRRENDGIHLDCLGVPLLLESRRGAELAWLTPEAAVEVYPKIWTLDETLQAGRHTPLPVRIHPRVDGGRRYWSPISLSVSESQLPELVKAHEHISSPSLTESPWRVSMHGADNIALSLGDVTFIARPEFEHRALKLGEVLWEYERSEVSVRLQAELNVCLEASEDENEADGSLFTSFIQSLYQELSSQKQQILQRRTALHLRKLSLIYLDQEEFFRSTSSCGIIIGKHEKGGRLLEGTLVEPEAPPWLVQAFSNSGTRIRAIGGDVSWDVDRAEWLNRHLGTFRIKLFAPPEASLKEISPYSLRRLELVGEGSQQQTLSRALENAILGRFSSASVHATLLGLPGEEIENKNLGQEKVEGLLSSDADVVAIWGPPGTGKTTTLVRWLGSLFPLGKEDEWSTILLTAPTHVAVTKLLNDLLEKEGRLTENVVRYGNEERVEGTGLEPVWHYRLLERLRTIETSQSKDDEGIQRWAEVLETREGREAAAQWVLGSRHIHAVTSVGMARRDYGLRNRVFDIAIVDEAGKAFGAELLIPAAVARKVILVGDHNQLPPTVTAEELDHSIGYRLPMEEVEELLHRNMFHEIFEQLPEHKKGMLTLQYRMHEHIGALVSELFYDGNLESHRTGGDWNLTCKRVVFADFTKVKGYRNRKHESTESQENKTERAALHALLHRLSLKNSEQKSLCNVLIVCPYKAQRAAVEDEVASGSYSFSVEVSTVDAVQGGEADMVVLLMTRSHGRVEFLLDRHRLNVALSRAREAVVILGHVGCLAPNGEGPIGRLIELGREKGTLELLKLSPRANFRTELAQRVIP